ncbi:DUF5642 family protein [Mycobacterium paraterrae]|uniref:DUF5642 family protein n=1 Tax=Mycobacterium paraterrae TaxID=577492 RepID=A0ABY3VNA5_9MYCO|nr:DUF5642 family protein [Mycobacterium paraterrae]UMB70919.1 DUF5642 family protein [Mycobacterium paraterrae]
MPTLSRRASRLTALGLITLSASACGGTQASQPSGSTTGPAVDYDIARVNNIKGDFPAGFTAAPEAPITLTRDDIDNARVIPFTKAVYAPPQCRALVIPTYVEPVVGAQAAILSAEGERGEIFVAAMRLPHPVEVSPPPPGCGHVAMSGSEESSGTAEAVPAPQIEGVTTTGVRLKPAADSSPGGYVFTAALSDQTSVAVMGGTETDLHPQQLLSDLLVKAVAAVRG